MSEAMKLGITGILGALLGAGVVFIVLFDWTGEKEVVPTVPPKGENAGAKTSPAPDNGGSETVRASSGGRTGETKGESEPSDEDGPAEREALKATSPVLAVSHDCRQEEDQILSRRNRGRTGFRPFNTPVSTSSRRLLSNDVRSRLPFGLFGLFGQQKNEWPQTCYSGGCSR